MSTTATLDPTTPLPPIPAVQTRTPIHPIPEPPVRLVRLMLILIGVVASFDCCFWSLDAVPGASMGLFVVVLGLAILVAREPGWNSSSTLVIFLLLLGSAFQSAVETCVTNLLVLPCLIIVLAGHTFYRDIASFSGRWISQAVALAFAPGRPFWLAARLAEAGVREKSPIGAVLRYCLLAIPAFVLVLFFGGLLSAGNAVFSSWAGEFFNWLIQILSALFDFERIFLWVFVACLTFPLLRPAQISEAWWKWTEDLPRWPEFISQSNAFVCSMMILASLNAMFLVANVADALFLWNHQALPSGVAMHDYVHEGVDALITTVVLSAILLTWIFHQVPAVSQRRELKVLAYLWIVQNLFLMLSVSEKIRLFIVISQMTTARLSCLIFLLLVGVGFVFLTIKIARDRSLSWLISRCVLASFSTLYITQFLNLAGWSADYNVTKMERIGFDAKTMCVYGSDVWPALRRAHDFAPKDADIRDCFEMERNSNERKFQSGSDWSHWREFHLRAWMNREALNDKK